MIVCDVYKWPQTYLCHFCTCMSFWLTYTVHDTNIPAIISYQFIDWTDLFIMALINNICSLLSSWSHKSVCGHQSLFADCIISLITTDQHSVLVYSPKYYIPFDLLNIDLLCCLCSGLEDQWVCGFEVLWGEHQHDGYGDQLQCEHHWPHVSKPACCISSGCVLLLLILLLIITLY